MDQGEYSCLVYLVELGGSKVDFEANEFHELEFRLLLKERAKLINKFRFSMSYKYHGNTWFFTLRDLEFLQVLKF